MITSTCKRGDTSCVGGVTSFTNEIKSMFEQFPDFKQEDRRICVFGTAALKEVTERGMKVNIQAGTPEAPSIAVALENYLKVANKN